MRLLAGAALVVATTGVAHAENVGFEAMADVFKWTAEGAQTICNDQSEIPMLAEGGE